MRTKRIGIIALGLALAVVLIALLTGKEKPAETKATDESVPVRTSLPDTLRVATLSGPTSYFTYRDEPMGLDYEMASRYADDNGMQLKLIVAQDLRSMVEMLKKGEVDMIAYNVPRIKEYLDGLEFVGRQSITHQVAVQQKNDSAAKSVTELIGRTIFVVKDSKYRYRLQNLNEELGGGIGIEAVVSDTIGETDLIGFVDKGVIPMTVIDSDLAEISTDYFKHIDVSLAVSMDQVSSWAVAAGDTLLANSINRWAETADIGNRYADIHKKYFEHLLAPTIIETPRAAAATDGRAMMGKGIISPYDASFRKHSASIGWDWRMLAAIGYNESRFNPEITSWAGAQGVMQLMPGSARSVGVADRITEPDANIFGASRILLSLDKSLASRVHDPAERRKFVIAAYNSGLGHILDAMELAKKYGKNPAVWYGNVRETALLKSKPEYYTDPVVKHGYFRARETVDFVDRVLSTYEYYCRNISR